MRSKPTMIVALLGGLGCGAQGPDDSAAPCAPTHAIVTDIDETLTTSDLEWVTQVAKGGDHDPAMRPDANTLMTAYADLGYAVHYVTARGDGLTLGDGRSSTQVTEDWLVAHDFPYDPDRLHLSPGGSTAGDAAVEYKTGVIQRLQAEGLTFEWAYGNARSDIQAFKNAGIPNDHIFLVGVLAGEEEVVGVGDEDAYVAHMAAQLPVVESRHCDEGGAGE